MHLSLDDLLEAVLGPVRESLAGDTAAVLLLEEGGDQLVVRAALGLRDEVEQRMAVPVGAASPERSPQDEDRASSRTCPGP